MKTTGILLLALAAASCALLPLRAQETAPATAPAAIPGRSLDQINKDIAAATEQFEAATSLQELINPASRKEVAPKAIPPLKKFVALLQEVEAADPQSREGARVNRFYYLAFLDLLGDGDAAKTLEAAAMGKDPKEALLGTVSKAVAAWLQDPKDAAGQTKILEGLQALARKNALDDNLAGALMMMSNLGAANKDVKTRAREIVKTDLHGTVAKEIQTQLADEGKADAMENKPLVIAGTTVDGKPFTTADWKGKVILVDFWATWCGPCRGELPNVKKLYTDYHAKGLEIVGVSCDRDAEDLKNFLNDDGNMPWPQIFEPGHDWSPIATKMGVSGIPTMFVIDKAGVLRSVNGREVAKDLVPKLLEEKVDAPAK